MRKELSAWTIYHYLVCFVTLMMVIVGTVQLVNNLVDYLLPTRVQWPSLESVQMRLGPEVDEETVRRQHEMEQSQMQRDMRERHLRSALRSLALIFVAAPVYVAHWRRINRNEKPPGHEGKAAPPGENT